MRFRTILLALVPGGAHVDLGRTRRGLGYFFLFVFLADGALMAPFLTAHPAARAAFATAAAGTWLLAFVNAVRAAGRNRT